jgi:hypothetical protein
VISCLVSFFFFICCIPSVDEVDDIAESISDTRGKIKTKKQFSCRSRKFASLVGSFDKTERARRQMELTVPVWLPVSIGPDYGYLYLNMQPIENKFITIKTGRLSLPLKF